MLYIRIATIEKINKRIKRINKIKIITFFIVVLLYFLYDYIRMFLKMKGFSMRNDVFFDSFLRSLRFHFRDKCKDIAFIEFFKDENNCFITIEDYVLKSFVILSNILSAVGNFFGAFVRADFFEATFVGRKSSEFFEP